MVSTTTDALEAVTSSGADLLVIAPGSVDAQTPELIRALDSGADAAPAPILIADPASGPASARALHAVVAALKPVGPARPLAERDIGVFFEDASAERALLEAVVEQMPAGVLVAKAPHGQLIITNHEAEVISGGRKYEAEDVADWAEYVAHRPDGDKYAPADYPLARSLVGGEVVIGEEMILERLDGTRRNLSCNTAPIRDAEDAILGSVGIFQDITAQRENERALEKKSTELVQRSLELERFTDLAAHDLQEPLRMLQCYVDLLQARLGRHDDDEVTEALTHVVDGATRMRALLSGLLTYGRIDSDAPLRQISTGDALAAAKRDVASLIDEAEATVCAGELPVVRGDAAQLRQLFRNLLSNAIRFRTEAPPQVRVDASADGGWWTFTVHDNGAGIDAAAAVEVFDIFRRWHPRAQDSGTGLGLAIAKRIVERHGGRIWIETRPGPGTTVRFTLPAVGPPGNEEVEGR